jgi:hypothetical protein
VYPGTNANFHAVAEDTTNPHSKKKVASCNSTPAMRLKLHKTMGRSFPRFFSSANSRKNSLDMDECKLGGCTEVEELDASISLSVTFGGTPEKGAHPEDTEDTPELCILDDSEISYIKPMMARLDALQIQQSIQGMNHPDVLFTLKHLARAHRRRGELEQAKLVEEMLHASHCNHGFNFYSFD